MRIHLIKTASILDFVHRNPEAKVAFMYWLHVVRNADWNTPVDIKKTFGTADFLGRGSNRVVFDIGGNKYRLILKYHFGKKEVHLFVCWIGDHKAYDKICKSGLQYTINVF